MDDALGREARGNSLRGVSIFSALGGAEREAAPLGGGPWAEVVAQATPVSIKAGEWLFRQGDPGDALYVVVSGRLEMVAEDRDPPVVIRLIARGGAVGELALLTGAARSASARAKRDTDLLMLTREDFERALAQRPAVGIEVARVLAAQLQATAVATEAPEPIPSTVAVVPLQPGLPAQDIGRALVRGVRQWRRVTGIDGSEVAGDVRFGPLLDREERANDQVILVAQTVDADDPWTDFCLRAADRLILVGDGERVPPGLAARPRLRGADLVVCERAPGRARMREWVEALDPRVSHRVAAGRDLDEAVRPVARRLAGRSVGIVLSGGGARGFAHIGVLEELTRAGIPIDRVAGASMGSYIAGQFAMGRSPEEIRETVRREFVDRNPVNDYTVPLVALLRSRKARAMAENTFGDARIEELPREYFCVSCDLVSAELVVHRRGSLVETSGASMAIPGIITPLVQGDRILVDGGVLNNLPADIMAESGEGPVIAVDVTARYEPPEREKGPEIPTRRAEVVERLRTAVTGTGARLPSLPETIVRSITLGSADTAAVAEQFADILITPETGQIGMLEWSALDRMVEEGRRAAREKLDTVPPTLLL